MADARHIIDIIIQAKDNTQEVFARVAAGAEELKAAQRDVARQTEQLGDSYDRAAKRMKDSNDSLTEANKKYKTSNVEVLNEIVRLEKATDRLHAARQKAKRDVAEEAVLESQVAEAIESVTAAYITEDKVRSDTAANRARRIQEKRAEALQDELINQRAIESLRILEEEERKHAAEERRLFQQGRIEAAAYAEDRRRLIQQEVKDIKDGQLQAKAIREDQARDERIQLEAQKAGRLQAKAFIEDEKRDREKLNAVHQEAIEINKGRDAAERKSIEMAQARARIEERVARAAQNFSVLTPFKEATEEVRRNTEEYKKNEGVVRRLYDHHTRSLRDVSSGLKDVRQETDRLIQAESRQARARDQLERAEKAGDTTEVVRIQLEVDAARRQADVFKAEMRAKIGEIDSFIELHNPSPGEIAALEAEKRLIGRAINLEVNLDTHRLRRGLEDNQSFVKRFTSEVGESLQGMSARVAAFDNVLRGLFSLAVVGFLGNIVQVAGAAAAAFAALASSALYAGGALGGALAAGAAQAIPTLGLLATALSRVKAVTDAAQQASLLDQQSVKQGDTVARAQATAQEAVAKAQEKVTEARKEARAEIEKLILAEKRAVLSLSDAQAALRQAIVTGQTGEIASRRLDVTEARQRLGEARGAVTEARTVGTTAQQSAAEQLKTAKQGAADAGTAVQASAAKLDYLMDKLSGAEKRLLTAVIRLQDVWRGFAQRATEPLINAFTRAVNRISDLLGGDKLVGLARGLSTAMGEQFTRAFNFLTSPEIIQQWGRIIGQAAENLRPLTTLALRLSRIFLDIAESAGPAFAELIRWVTHGVGEFGKFIAKGSGAGGELENFFERGLKHLKAWVNLLASIGDLFLAIADPKGGGGAREGLKLIEQMTGGIRKFADEIRDQDSTASEFFRNLFKVMDQTVAGLKIVFRSVGEQLVRIFGSEAGNGGASIKGFATIIADVLIPALGSFIIVMTGAVRRAGEFFERFPSAAFIAAQGLGLLAFGSVVLKLAAFFSPLRVAIGLVNKELATTGKHLPLLEKLSKLRPGSAAARASEVQGAKAIATGGAGAGAAAGAAGAGGVGAGAVAATGGIILLAAAVAYLVVKFNLLDDIVRGVKKAFKTIVDDVKPAFKDLEEALRPLNKALGNENGLMGILKILTTIVIKALIIYIQILANIIGRSLAAAVQVVVGIVKGITALVKGVSDIFTLIDDVIHGRWEKVAGDFKDIGEDILKGFLEPWIGIGKAIIELLKAGIDNLKTFLGISSPSKLFHNIGEDLIRGLIRGMRSLPLIGTVISLVRNIINGFRRLVRGDNIGDIFRDAFNNALRILTRFPGRFLEAGKAIARGLVNGIKKLPELLGDLGGFALGIAKTIFKAFDKNLPDHLDIKGLPDIPLPDNPLKDLGLYAQGGPVPGSGDRDSVPALLTPDEHVITKSEVKGAGGHGVIFALRRLWGGGGQAYGGKYQVGGAGGKGNEDDARVVQAQTLNILGVLAKFDKSATKAWREIWNGLDTITRRNLRNIEDRVENSLRRVNIDFNRRGDRIRDSMQKTMQGVMRAVFTGFDYVGDATKAALQVFDARVPKLSVPRPRDITRATGGWIGQQGERGRDGIRTVLGRGEAVLNWGHQKIVNSALWNQYGTTLDGVFKSTKGYHAGGAEQPGYAMGGFTGPGHSGAGFTPVWNMARNKFGMTNFTGKDGHSYLTSSGNVSAHSMGQALDMANNQMIDRPKDALAGFIKSKLGPTISQLIWRDKVQAGTSFLGGYVGGHQDHVHYAMHRQYAFDGDRMAKIISRASRGLSISELLASSLGGIDVDHVARILVKGTGALKDLSQNVIDRVRKAANKFIDRKAGQESGGGFFRDTDALYNGPLNKRFPAHSAGEGGVQLTPQQVMEVAIAAGLPGRLFEQIAHGESNYFPGVISSDGGYGLWQMTPRVWGAAGIAKMNSLGGVNAMLNPFKNALMAKYLYDAAGQQITPWYGTGFVTGRARGGYVGEFAEGGEIPGGGGRPVRATVHEGEWILNPRQQSVVTKLTGIAKDKLKGLLGFRSATQAGFKEGGEVLEQFGGVPYQRQQARRGNFVEALLPLIDFSDLRREANLVQRALKNMNKKAKDYLENFAKTIGKLVNEGGIFDQMKAESDRVVAQLTTNLGLRVFSVTRRLGAFRRRSPEQEAQGEIRILQRTAQLINDQRELIAEAQFRVNRELRKVRQRMAQLRRSDGGVTKDEKEEFEGLKDRAGELIGSKVDLRQRRQEADQALVDNLRERFEAAQEVIRRAIERRGRPAAFIARALQSLEARGLGSSDDSFNLIAGQIKEQQKLIPFLQKKLAAAQKKGMTELADEIAGQLADLQDSIAENAAKLIEAQIATVNDRAAKQLAGLDILQRASTAIRGLTGNTVGAARDTEAITRARGEALIRQRAELEGQRRNAMIAAFTMGNTKPIDDLNAAIAELGVQITENTLAQKDAATATRQAMIDQITNRSQFRQGVFGNLGSILEAVGATDEQQQALKDRSAGELKTTGGDLRNQLLGFGVDLRGLSGAGFVEAVQGLLTNMDSITANMTQANKDQFQNLVNAIIENELAVQQNTNALNEANKEPVTWATSSWQWFREAIFTGMGDVLPQYQVPALQTGGFITKSGLFQLHAGEFVVNPAHSPTPVNQGDTHITIQEAGGPVDVTHLANRLAFAQKTAR